MGAIVTRHAFLALTLLGALSCSDSTGPNVSGSVAFSFTGGGGGTLTAAGNAPSLIAPRSGSNVDLAVLRFEGTATGSQNIDAACNIDGSTSCTGMELLLNFNGNGDTGDFFCALTSGTIVITEISAARAKGTFSGTGSCLAGGGSSAFAVSNGTFDVALVSPPA
jgi:hypothetical protein